MTKLNRCKNFLAVSLWALKLKQLAPLFCRRSHVTGMTRVTYAEDVLPEKTHGTQHCNTSPGSWPCHCHEDRFAEILESCQCNQKRSLAKLHRGVGFLQSSLHAEITRKTAFQYFQRVDLNKCFSAAIFDSFNPHEKQASSACFLGQRKPAPRPRLAGHNTNRGVLFGLFDYAPRRWYSFG